MARARAARSAQSPAGSAETRASKPVRLPDPSRTVFWDAASTRRVERPVLADQRSTINCRPDATGRSQSRGRRPRADRVPTSRAALGGPSFRFAERRSGAGRGAAGVTNARSRARAGVETRPDSINPGRRTGEAGGLTTPAPRSRRASKLTAVKQSLNATSPSDRSKTQKIGGGGGNRTHVRIASSGRVYVCSLRLISEMPGAMTSQAFPSST